MRLLAARAFVPNPKPSESGRLNSESAPPPAAKTPPKCRFWGFSGLFVLEPPPPPGHMSREPPHGGGHPVWPAYSRKPLVIGMRRSRPNALGVIFTPGAPCRRLYSLRSTSFATLRTVASSNPAAMMSFTPACCST